MVAICYPFHQEHLSPASISSHQVDIQSFHSITYPPPEAAVSKPEAQEAKVSKLQMASEAEDILDKVDSIMGEMRTNPVADIEEELLENNLMRLDTLMNDVRACLKQFIGWNRRYKEEEDATLKLQVDVEVSKMEAYFKTFKLEMVAKKRAFQSTSPSPPASPPPSPPCPGPGSARLCAKQDQTM